MPYRLCSALIAAQGIALTAQDTQWLHRGFAHAHFHHGSFVGGAKGIALLDESSGFPRLHYVFDVSDTGVRRNSRDPEVWQFNDDLKQPVSEMLAATYGISGERVSQQLADVAGKLVADYWDNNGGDIRAIVDGSLLMDYDGAGVEMNELKKPLSRTTPDWSSSIRSRRISVPMWT